MTTDRFGQQVLVTVSGSPLVDRTRHPRGAILTMDEHALDEGQQDGQPG